MDYSYPSTHNDSILLEVVGHVNDTPVVAWDGVLNDYSVPPTILALVPWSITEDWKQHRNGGGYVHKSSWVSDSAWVDEKAAVYGGSLIEGNVKLIGLVRVSGQVIDNYSSEPLEIRESIESLEQRIKNHAVAECKADGCRDRAPHTNDSHDIRAVEMRNVAERMQTRQMTGLNETAGLV